MIETVGNVDPVGRSVMERLIDERFCRSACYREESKSTNSDALADLRDQPLAEEWLPRLYLADRQTSGRGRQGNSWLTGEDALTFSLVIDFDSVSEPHSRLLSLAAGVAIARGIEFLFAPAKSRLKWPNDVYLAGGKVAGILIETSQAFSNRLVMGVGVNVNESPAFPVLDETAPPQSLYGATGRRMSRFEVLEAMIQNLTEATEQLRQSPMIILTEFRNRCMLTGKQISFRESGDDCQGNCRGIADDGSLMIQTASGLRNCDSGAIRMVRVKRPF
ncbi:biotin--[acetyl-CoA-carboxylase] ligase [Novipirellula artificiosorum]|uniref:Bifunctional ligase/repressor BirA n=1 Tax=Novipirellula artificiosorum TaxID=2528016 RepID=A0A5C6DGQ3_9BACT|nr:biotin--[acetyl-CoA-carboxylase] ligase [Novipirellula artificiosorum]TWU36000.1 Bifunctional ligase/repressor BirA [Novipirellula artificiosorum]